MQQEVTLQIPLVISILRHIKYGADILLSPQNVAQSKDFALFEINLRIAEDLITLACLLKMKELEQSLIKSQILNIINRDNCLKYA
jgi:hypothetical protein